VEGGHVSVFCLEGKDLEGPAVAFTPAWPLLPLNASSLAWTPLNPVEAPPMVAADRSDLALLFDIFSSGNDADNERYYVSRVK
jgi:hypothetical protein